MGIKKSSGEINLTLKYLFQLVMNKFVIPVGRFGTKRIIGAFILVSSWSFWALPLTIEARFPPTLWDHSLDLSSKALDQ